MGRASSRGGNDGDDGVLYDLECVSAVFAAYEYNASTILCLL